MAMLDIRQIVRNLTPEYWEIGLIITPLGEILRGKPITVEWIDTKKFNSWFADPFILSIDTNEIIILAEEFPIATQRGRISRLTIDRKSLKVKEIKVILELPTHLSFPNYRVIDNELFVYPENTASGVLKRYRYNTTTNKLEEPCVICQYPIADAVEFMINGKWFLMGTLLPDPNGNKLSIFRWNGYTYIPYQDVYFEEKVARMAGNIFNHNGKLYRPTQECNQQYGHAVTIQQIKFNNEKFSFSEIRRLHSVHPRLQIGMHTFNVNSQMIITDALGFKHQWIRTALKKIGLK